MRPNQIERTAKFEAMFQGKTVVLNKDGVPIFKETKRVLQCPICRDALASMLEKYSYYKISL